MIRIRALRRKVEREQDLYCDRIVQLSRVRNETARVDWRRSWVDWMAGGLQAAGPAKGVDMRWADRWKPIGAGSEGMDGWMDGGRDEERRRKKGEEFVKSRSSSVKRLTGG